MEEVKLNMMMMGKTGNGKSATANMILDKRVNKAASKTTSETKDVSYSCANFDNFLLLVVDGPGLQDTELTEDKDKEEAAKNMDKALAMCYGGVDAFLFVYRFANRMTTEERSALDALKQIFGDSFMNHVIVVVTYGDEFHRTMEEENSKISFIDWCREQEGEFQKLLKDCDNRVVLFNNREKDDAKKREQVGQIVQLTHNLKTKAGRYTSQCFKLAEQERKKLILNYNAPHLRLEIQKKMCILQAEVDNLSANSSNSDKQRVRELIIDLKQDLLGLDCPVLRDLLIVMENHLNDAEELLRLNTNLENIRRAKTVWNLLGKICTVVGGALALVEPNQDVQRCIQRRNSFSLHQVMRGGGSKRGRRPLYLIFLLEAGCWSSGSPAGQYFLDKNKSQTTLEKPKINFVLVGKSGYGLSATGNTLLGKRVFREYVGTGSGTNSVDCSCSTYGRHNLLVVDQPGLCNTEMNEIDDQKAAVNNLSKALELCRGNVDAFLLVFMFGWKFINEDKCMMRAVKQIMGVHFMKHVIVVLTCGDTYEWCMEEDNCVMSFDEWCQKNSSLHELYDECEGRFVLLNNREKNEDKKTEQIEKLLQVSQDLTSRRGRYTSKDFESARVQRERFILKLDVPKNRRIIADKLLLLASHVNNLVAQPSNSNVQVFRQLVHELKHEIQVKDSGYGFYADFQKDIQTLENGGELSHYGQSCS